MDVHLCPQFLLRQIRHLEQRILRSADGVMIIALFPPSSKRDVPNLAPTAALTDLPILVEPVAETKGTLVSFDINFPIICSIQ